MFVHRVSLPASGYQQCVDFHRVCLRAAAASPRGATTWCALLLLLLLCVCPQPPLATTVSAVLHAGSWARAQTTAPACRAYHHRPPPLLLLQPPPPPPTAHTATAAAPATAQRAAFIVLLAALCLLAATVTLAARCDARSHAAAADAAPAHDSTSSSLVLSSLLAHNLPRDISIIDAYSKRERRTLRRREVGDYSNRIFARQSGGGGVARKHRRIVRTLRRLETGAPRERYDGPEDLSEQPTIRLINWHLETTPPTIHRSAGIPRLRDTSTKFPNNSVVDSREVTVNESVNVFVDESTLGDSDIVDTKVLLPSPTDKRPMPPEHQSIYTKDLLHESGGLLVLVAACLVLTLALGLVTCVLSHYRGGGGILADPPDVAQTPTTAPMLSVVSAGATAGVGGMDRLRGRGAARDLTAAAREHQMRLHSVHTDIAINLPPSISLPDGEEHPFSSRLHLRDSEQESEIYQKCIRPPPNRTALESESPPPYRSSSAGLLGTFGGGSGGGSNSSYGSSSGEWSSSGSAPLVVRCHSMSASSASLKRTTTDTAHTAGHHHHHHHTAGSGSPKTDFLQKTVKILTGKKSQPTTPPAPTLPPVIIVPTTRARRTPTTSTATDQQSTAAVVTGAASHLNHNQHHQPSSNAQPNNHHSNNAHV